MILFWAIKKSRMGMRIENEQIQRVDGLISDDLCLVP